VTALIPGTRAATLPYIPLQLEALRGQASVASALAGEMTSSAHARGEGCAITVAEYAMAVLANGLGQYEVALDAARRATAGDIATSSWALPELVEAASRAGRRDVARGAAERLSDRARASGASSAKGTAARALALVAGDEAAEDLHREAMSASGGRGWRRTWPVPGSATESGSGARAGASTPASSCAARTTPSPRWAPAASATAPGGSCWPRARRSAGVATTPGTTSRRRSSTSRSSPGTDGPTRRRRRAVPQRADGRMAPAKVFAKLGITSRMGLHDARASGDEQPTPA
jgi:hypothetical protein